MIRCNNCGTLGHLPRACPNYGWYFPAPGKTREDYADDRQRVQDLVARDIIEEHAVHEHDDHLTVFKGSRPNADIKAQALLLPCPRCGQGPGEKCKTVAGDLCELHKGRLDAVDSGAPGM